MMKRKTNWGVKSRNYSDIYFENDVGLNLFIYPEKDFLLEVEWGFEENLGSFETVNLKKEALQITIAKTKDLLKCLENELNELT